ncbi:YgcG family protein [Aerosakkonemataceae cyanobacterium BLCC-F50]|uniref:YgcG family protein n=1 Tax=Floridaenema flaviceps BLCC-F50 TaxID=3153642 RepID=A0ABV4XSV4_9CYAN
MKFTYQIRVCAAILTLFLITFPLPTWAVTVGSVPNPRQTNGTYVTDMANILTPETELEINRQIGELEAKNGTEIAVVTVPDTSPYISPKKFATSLFNRWGIGKKSVNNGVLFVIAQNERRVEIETGNGVREVLPDREVSEIIQKEILPKFKQGNFDGGTLTGTKALILKLDDSPAPVKIDDGFWKKSWLFILIGFAMTGFVLAIRDVMNVKKHGKLNKNQNSDRTQNYTWYGSGSSGWSSGGGSFGGGSSSGGGSGGSW